MGYIRKKMHIKGNKGSDELDVLVDSGANMSYIMKEKAEGICDINYYDDPIPIPLADKKRTVKDVGYCSVETKINGKVIHDDVDVLDMEKVKDRPDMFLGNQTLEKYNLNLKMQKGTGESYIDTSEYESSFNLI